MVTSFVESQTQNRYALVIGNNDYRNNVRPLLTAVNDATDISNSLRNLGYEVDLKSNITISEFDEIIDQFIEKLNSNRESEGFFWYAGHGLNVDNKHYLLPIDVDPRSDSSIVRGSYSVDTLVARFDSIRNRANLIVIDACRNDSIPGNRSLGGRGLSVISTDSIVGNLIVYSTMAGQTAADGNPGDRNSPFAASFLIHLRTAISFDNLFIRIADETRRRTNGVQRPYKVGYFTIENYSLAPLVNDTIRPTGGLRVISNTRAADMFIFYSTQAGGVAADGGPNDRNSPFAQSFLNNFNKPEPLNLLAIDIVADAYTLTSQRQKPTYDSQIINNRMYSLVNSSDRKYALVIGISDYPNRLQNTTNDAQDIARALISLGYNVDLRINISLTEINNATSAFISRLSADNESEGFFWYAGMGVEINSEKYLFPAGAYPNNENQVRTLSFLLDRFIEDLRLCNNKINVLFVDTCRDNPFPSSR